MNFGQWLGMGSFIISLYILWQIKHLLLLIFTAIVLATALNRLVRCLQRYGFKRNPAIIVVLSLGLLIGSLFLWLIVPPFIEQFQNLIELLPKVFQQVRSQLMDLEENKQLDWLPPLPTWADLIAQLQPLATELFKNFFSFFSNSLTVILQLLLVFVLMLMMLVKPQQYRQACLKLFPSFYRRRADEILSVCEVALGNWLGGIALNCIFIGTLSALGLWILQIRLVLVHALLAGLLNFIPNIGPATSVIFPLMIALLDAPWWKIVGILVWYFIIQNLESYWFSPTVMAKRVSLLPAVTLTAQLFFAKTFGILGLLLALPLAVVTKTWIDELLFKDILDKWDNIQGDNLVITQSSSEALPELDQTNAG
ncbi:MAG: AI-2E family transporter [Moorea sp. SIO2B7]|nr:AI-2E family transporter [Moorena sp. SIO2B7]